MRKNTRTINRQRKKWGKPELADAASGTAVFRGRSWMFASFLLMVSLFLLITQGATMSSDGMYWFTVISYAVLALIIFLRRRPYLKVYKNQLATRKWTGEKIVTASEIEKISLLPGYVVIHFNGKRSWVFSKLIHLYPIGPMGERLAEFAKANKVALEGQTNTKGN